MSIQLMTGKRATNAATLPGILSVAYQMSDNGPAAASPVRTRWITGADLTRGEHILRYRARDSFLSVGGQYP